MPPSPAVALSNDPRVLLADDQAVVGAGFRLLLEAEPHVEVLGEALDGK